MRWPDRHRLAAAALLVLLPVPARGGDDPIEARIEVVDRTERILTDKRAARAVTLRARVRALYKLSRAGAAPLWVDADERAALLRRRGAARRILRRDLRELAILRDELAAVLAARARLRTARALAEDVARPAPGSLTRPVPGAVVSRFGGYRGRRSRARLTRRGVKLAARAGQRVVAPHAGRVEYAGPLRGLGEVVVVGRDDGVRSVVGRLRDVRVAVGDEVAAGDPLGAAAGSRVYLEVRLDLDAGGLPIDPAPLLGR